MMEAPPVGSVRRAETGLAVVRITSKAAKRLRAQKPLLLRAEVLSDPPPLSTDQVLLCDERGQAVATALWAAVGPVAARLWSLSGEPFSRQIIEARLRETWARRRLLFRTRPRDAFRLVHAEADGLPGLVVDCYGDAAVIQTGTQAMNRHKPLLAALVKELLPVSRIVCRDDGSARDLESLPREAGFLLGGPSPTVRYHDAGSIMEADLLSDRKTGSFLDQQDNHQEVAAWASELCPQGQALDAFTYHGGFALALARAGFGVIACDEDPKAIARARKNAELSQVTVDFRVHNAFDLLRAYESEGRRFDLVVVDPPALAKRGRTSAQPVATALVAALRAYKELNLRAMRLLRPGGLLATCSCSGRITIELFSDMLRSAAQDSGRSLELLWRRGASADHPVLWSFPESEYLKCWLFRARPALLI